MPSVTWAFGPPVRTKASYCHSDEVAAAAGSASSLVHLKSRSPVRSPRRPPRNGGIGYTLGLVAQVEAVNYLNGGYENQE